MLEGDGPLIPLEFGNMALGYAQDVGGIGRYVLAYAGLGRYLFTLKRQDPEAVELFRRWVPWFEKYAGKPPN